MVVVLVEQNNSQLSRLKETVKSFLPNCRLFCFSSYSLENLIQLPQVDIAFINLKYSLQKAIQYATRLQQKNDKINLIFISNSTNFAFKAHKMHASGYMLEPLNRQKVIDELLALRFPQEDKPKLRVQCFGNFEVFYDGCPLKFTRNKTKELFAYLVDRQGAGCSMNELNSVLWEDDNKNSYLRNLIADLTKTLASIGAGDVFVKKFNKCYILPNKIACDYYDYQNHKADGYLGEYMAQYSWAEETNGFIGKQK